LTAAVWDSLQLHCTCSCEKLCCMWRQTTAERQVKQQKGSVNQGCAPPFRWYCVNSSSSRKSSRSASTTMSCISAAKLLTCRRDSANCLFCQQYLLTCCRSTSVVQDLPTLSLLKFSPLWNLALALVSDNLIFNSLHPVSKRALTLAYFLFGGGGPPFGTPPMGFACKGIVL